MSTLRAILKSVGVLLVAGWFIVTVWETQFYEQALPAELETWGPATTGSDAHWWYVLVPARWEACGGAIFHMTPATIEKINAQGLEFFSNAIQGRGYLTGRLKYYYKPWAETPVPLGWTGDGVWSIGLHCIGTSRARQIAAAAKEPGSYYTQKDEAELLVIPKLGLIVLTYFG
jgi:hypothetical protein